MRESPYRITAGDVDAVWFDAGGVLVLPDPTVLIPLLSPYGGTASVAAHRRAHYAGMAAKSRAGSSEADWAVYDLAYVTSVGVDEDLRQRCASLLGRTRTADLWRWPIPESVSALASLAERGIPMSVVSNAAGQIEWALAHSGLCSIDGSAGVMMRTIVDSHIVGVAKPDPAIFDHAAVVHPEHDRSRIAYVGDSVIMDVEGSAAAGLRPVLIDPYDDSPDAPAHRIASLDDVVALFD